MFRYDQHFTVARLIAVAVRVQSFACQSLQRWTAYANGCRAYAAMSFWHAVWNW